MFRIKHLFDVDNFVTESILFLKGCVIFNMGERKSHFTSIKVCFFIIAECCTDIDRNHGLKKVETIELRRELRESQEKDERELRES